MKIQKPFLWILILALAVLIAFGLGWWFSHRVMKKPHLEKSKKSPIYWVAPMNPNYRRDKPGKSPMGMDLVPVYQEPQEEGVVEISPAIENNLGVRIAVVEKKQLNQKIRAVGYVQPNENSLKTISVYTAGWIKDLQVKAVGDPVKEGQLLFKLYSPVLVSAEEEYLLALKHNNRLLVQAGKEKLFTLGMSEKGVDRLTLTRKAIKNVSVYAPQPGYVMQLNIREGAHVMPATPLMNIANLSTVWVIAEVYEQQAALLKTGQVVNAYFSGLPDKVITGKIDYIYPTFNAKTRTTRVRLEFSNLNNQLKPGMYVNVNIDINNSKPVLVVPKEALIQLGDTNRVVLALGGGKFKPVSVKVGEQDQDWVSITEGLTLGQKVVISAQFLLDSESSLKAGLKRLDKNAANGQPASKIKHSKGN
jgi:Cu(I)/Ag(I) efflux system membrane fusion protein